MNLLPRLLIFLLVFLNVVSALAADPESSAVDAVFAEYDSTISPGCSLGVYRDGEIAYARGYGMANLEYGIANATNTVFRIGSTSKQFTAMAIALLAEEGKLSLDDDIRTFFPQMPEYSSPVTVRQLVHHTSGVRDYLTLAALADWSNDYSIAEALDIITRQQELNFAPGEEYLYSNSGYFLLAQIVEVVTGKPLREWAEEKIFRPLDMKHSHFHDDHAYIVPRRADGYGPTENGFRISMTILDMVGDGGVFTTVEDLLPWHRNFAANRLGRAGQDLIKLMETPARLNSGEATDYGFGLVVSDFKGVPMVSHGGAFVGFRAEYLRFPEHDLGVAVFCNLATTNPSRLARQVAELYLGDILETEPVETEEKEEAEEKEAEKKGGATAESQTVDLSVAELARYEGEYWNRESAQVRQIRLVEGNLVYDRGRGSVTPLAPLGEGRFEMTGREVEVILQFEGEGPTRRLTVTVAGGEAWPLERLERWQPTAEELKNLAGSYYSTELDHTQLISWIDGTLQALRRGSLVELEPVVPDYFLLNGSGLVFERGKKKRITGYRMHAGRVKNLLYLRQP